MPIPEKLLDHLKANRIQHEILQHRVTFTAQEMAEATHISGRDVAKAVIIRDGEKHLMVVLSADCLVDLARLAPALGLKNPHLSTEAEIAGIFPDCELGAIPVFGNLYGLPVFVDSQLVPEEHIAFAAGSHHQTIRMCTSDFMRDVSPRVVDIGVPA